MYKKIILMILFTVFFTAQNGIAVQNLRQGPVEGNSTGIAAIVQDMSKAGSTGINKKEVTDYISAFQYIDPVSKKAVTFALEDSTFSEVEAVIKEVYDSQRPNYQKRIDKRVMQNPAVLAKLCLIWEHSPVMMGRKTKDSQSALIRQVLMQYVTDDEVSCFVEENLGEDIYERMMADPQLFAQLNLIYDYAMHRGADPKQQIQKFLRGISKSSFEAMKEVLRGISYHQAGWSTFFDNKYFNPKGCIGDTRTASPIAYLKYAFREGLTNIEIPTDFLPFDPDKRLPAEIDEAERQRIKALAELYGVAVTVHSPLIGPQHPKTGSKQLFEEPVDNMPLQRDVVDLAEDFGASVLVIHIVDKQNPAGYADIVKMTEGKRVRIGFENYSDKLKRFPTADEHYEAFRKIMQIVAVECPQALLNGSLLLDVAHFNLVSNFEDPLIAATTVKTFAEELANELNLTGDRRGKFISGLVSEVHANQNIGPIRFFKDLNFFSADLHSDLELSGTIANEVFMSMLFHQGFRPYLVAEQIRPVTVDGRLLIHRSAFNRPQSSYKDNVALGEAALEDWRKRDPAGYEELRPVLEDARLKTAYQYFVACLGLEPLRNHIERRMIHSLVSLYYFNGLPQEFRFELNITPRIERYKAGENIVTQDTYGDELFIIRKGKVKVVKSFERAGVGGQPPYKEDVVVAPELGEGEFFGEMALLSPDHLRQATVIATEDTEVVRVPQDEFNSIRYRLPKFAEFVEGIAGKRAAANENYRETFRNLDMGDRLLWLLRKLQVPYERHEAFSAIIKKMIAEVPRDEKFRLIEIGNDGSSLPIIMTSVFSNADITVVDKDRRSFRVLEARHKFMKELLKSDVGDMKFNEEDAVNLTPRFGYAADSYDEVDALDLFTGIYYSQYKDWPMNKILAAPDSEPYIITRNILNLAKEGGMIRVTKGKINYEGPYVDHAELLEGMAGEFGVKLELAESVPDDELSQTGEKSVNIYKVISKQGEARVKLAATAHASGVNILIITDAKENTEALIALNDKLGADGILSRSNNIIWDSPFDAVKLQQDIKTADVVFRYVLDDAQNQLVSKTLKDANAKYSVNLRNHPIKDWSSVIDRSV